MVSFRYLAAGLVMVTSCLEGAAAQEPSQRPGREAYANRPIQREPEIGGCQLHARNCVPDH